MSNSIQKDVSLKEYSHIRIGGLAEWFLEIKDAADLKAGLSEWRKIAPLYKVDEDKIFIIGGATNILFSDSNFEGLIIKNSIKFIQPNAGFLEVGAGTTIEEINDFCIENSQSGIEWAGGLPGTLGGAIFGNAGAFGTETKDVILSVKSYDLKTGETISRPKSECLFGYRNSIFKHNSGKEIVISAMLKSTKGVQKEIIRLTNEKIEYRKKRQPLEYPNIGSIFKNVDLKQASKELIKKCKNEIKNDPFPVIPVAFLISLAGLKEKSFDGAQISSKHPNFIINTGEAKAKDIRELIKIVEKKLNLKFGVEIEKEIIQI